MLNLTTMQGAREKLHASRGTIYRMVVEGALPAPHHIRKHRKSYFPTDEFEASAKKELGLRTPESSPSEGGFSVPTVIEGTGGMLNLITMQQACEKLHTSRRTIYRMVAEGALPTPHHLREHRKSYFPKDEFEAAVNKELGLRTPKSASSRWNSVETGCAATSSERRLWGLREAQIRKGRARMPVTNQSSVIYPPVPPRPGCEAMPNRLAAVALPKCTFTAGSSHWSAPGSQRRPKMSVPRNSA
ncbi:MAG: DNA-binding protein [Burkholderiaceae bacterium]|nr:MAG: DNA-binding protein [Burkholderiaceae bacterium]